MQDFYERVYEIVALIPPGRVTSYGAIAKAIGAAKSSRLVGIAMNNSHLTYPQLPAHRVVNRNGVLTGKLHFNYAASMQELLEKEGITIVNDRVENFDFLLWDPSENI